MNTIYKYELQLSDSNEVEMPADAEVLTAQMQNEKIYIWAKVKTENPLMKRIFVIVGTGNPMYDGLHYIATVQEGQFVWHVFEEFL